MTIHRRAIAVLALTFTLGLSGCDSSSTPHACSLLD